MCNHIPCCGYCYGMERGIKREGSFKTYETLGLHPLCPDCLIHIKFKHELNTERHGNLKYFYCNNCETEFVSRRNGELEISANNYR